jgi:hypothetical protein
MRVKRFKRTLTDIGKTFSFYFFLKMFSFFEHMHSKFEKVLIRGASKIKLKKVNKKRMVTVRRVIIFLNISRHPLLI